MAEAAQSEVCMDQKSWQEDDAAEDMEVAEASDAWTPDCEPSSGDRWQEDSHARVNPTKRDASWTQDTYEDQDDDIKPPPAKRAIQCTANGRRPMDGDTNHCPLPQSFVRCGPHHRAHLKDVCTKADVECLTDIWWRYRDDLTWPWYEKKPLFRDADYRNMKDIADRVVCHIQEEYGEEMVLDQATISNTNHLGHPPHADNVQFDSVWWKGKRIRKEDEVVAAQEGAYVLWKTEKTSYRSYSCTVSLTDPDEYEGGEVHFFKKWGDRDPVEKVKPDQCSAVSFCGCQKNIHAVQGVWGGFRLQLLIWTRPPNSFVPESQRHVCYFRPGTGLGVWLTTADVLKHEDDQPAWLSQDDVDQNCLCEKCVIERRKVSWKDAQEAIKGCEGVEVETPTTSAGESPPPSESPRESPQSGTSSNGEDEPSADNGRETEIQHCPEPQCQSLCTQHNRVDLKAVLTKEDVDGLYWVWKKHSDDLNRPYYDKKPEFTARQFHTFRDAAQKVVDAMSEAYREPLVLDQATVSSTNHLGHPPHAANVQFHSVWCKGSQIKQRDELAAVRGGAFVLWKPTQTSYRSYGASVGLCDTSDYGGGDLEFYERWGDREPVATCRHGLGDGISYCGCQHAIHAVTGVKWGTRLVLLVWVRLENAPMPDDQKHVCYYRPGTGNSIWLTTADLEQYPQKLEKLDKLDKLDTEEDEWSDQWWQQDDWKQNNNEGVEVVR